MEPGPAVVEERLKLEGSVRPAATTPPVVLNSPRLNCRVHAAASGSQLADRFTSSKAAAFRACVSRRTAVAARLVGSISPRRHSRIT